MSHYTTHAKLAIAVGGSATVGALAILLAQPIGASLLSDWSQWRLDHFLLPLIVGITIAAGHLCGRALRGLRLLPALGFAVIFAIGTLLTVYSSVGAQRATVDLKRAEATAANRPITAKQEDLELARKRHEQAEAMADHWRNGAPDQSGRATTRTGCGRNCQDWELRAREVAAHIATIEKSLASLGAERVVAPGKARPFADAMAVLGFDRDKVELIARTFEPFAYSLLFELTAIVAFGYGFGGRPRQQPQQTSGKVVPFRQVEPRAIDEDLSKVSDAEIEEAAKHLRRDGGLMNRTLAAKLGVAEGTCTKLVDAAVALGRMTRETDPADKRRVIIRAAA